MPETESSFESHFTPAVLNDYKDYVDAQRKEGGGIKSLAIWVKERYSSTPGFSDKILGALEPKKDKK
jgi:hypothetical protein